MLPARMMARTAGLRGVHRRQVTDWRDGPRGSACATTVVELRIFSGLESEEIADPLGISPATVKRDWALARAWLHRELGSSAA